MTARSPVPFEWRMPSISLNEALLFNLLPLLQTLDSRLCWRKGQRSRGELSAFKVMLDAGGEPVTLFIRKNRLMSRLCPEPFNYAAPTEVAALLRLKAHNILARVERFCAAPVRLTNVSEEIVPSGWLNCVFTSGRFEIDCWLDAESGLRALSARRIPPSLRCAHITALELPCMLKLRAIQITQQEFSSLATGDLIVINVNNESALSGVFETACAGVRHKVSYEREGIMIINEAEIDIEPVSDDCGPEQVEIELSVEMAICRMTIRDIAALRPGSVVRLSRTTDDLSVVIKQNGKKVASGSLMDIGGVTGVWLDHIYLSQSA